MFNFKLNRLQCIFFLNKNDPKIIQYQFLIRLIPINPGDFGLLGFSADGLYHIDKCIPMACSIKCKIWETFATFQQRFTQQFMSGLNTLDNFLGLFCFCRK